MLRLKGLLCLIFGGSVMCRAIISLDENAVSDYVRSS